jgi:hypothetical protein
MAFATQSGRMLAYPRFRFLPKRRLFILAAFWVSSLPKALACGLGFSGRLDCHQAGSRCGLYGISLARLVVVYLGVLLRALDRPGDKVSV